MTLFIIFLALNGFKQMSIDIFPRSLKHVFCNSDLSLFCKIKSVCINFVITCIDFYCEFCNAFCLGGA